MRFTFLILLIPALAGCAMHMPSQGKLAEAQETYNAQDDNLCRFRGATVGTDVYVECRRQLAQEHVDAAAAQERQAQQQANQQPPQR
jgi:hypothetical protein